MVILGVHNIDDELEARFRLKIITGKIRLNSMEPKKSKITNAGDYHYYYYSSNTTVFYPDDYWEFIISTQVFTSEGDVDLFVTFVDARNPTSEDYDFGSSNIGPDDIMISENITTFFEDKSYALGNGLLFIVGVKAITDNVEYSILLVGPERY